MEGNAIINDLVTAVRGVDARLNPLAEAADSPADKIAAAIKAASDDAPRRSPS